MHTATSSSEKSYGDDVVRAAKIVGVMAAGLLLVGCSGGDSESDNPGDSSSPATGSASEGEPRPTLGRTAGTPTDPPARPMARLENAVAVRLRAQVAGQGLRLDYLDCPKWDGMAPQQLICKGYLNGVTADVRVRLTRTTTSVNFDARLQDPVLATANVERRLREDGYTAIDCGKKPAYPAVVGSEVVCKVSKDGAQKYVVATVLEGSRTVQISDY